MADEQDDRPSFRRHGEPVVSSAHLAQSSVPALSEMEFALSMTSHAFQRWSVRCMAAAGAPGMSSLEVLVVHLVHHRKRAKTLADICLILNIEDTHLANYAIKKLVGRGLVTLGKSGKEKTVAATPEGSDLCRRYGEIRENLLLRSVHQLGFEGEDMSRLSALLRALSGSYDQAARSAAVMPE